MSVKGETVEERKAEVLIKLRKYKLIEKEKYEGAIGYVVNIPEDKEKAMIWCILAEATVGIAAMNLLYKVMKEKELNRAIVVTEGRYTHAVKLGAKKKNVELLLKSFPVFDIFEHALVPMHEILGEKEKEQLLAQYKVQPVPDAADKINRPSGQSHRRQTRRHTKNNKEKFHGGRAHRLPLRSRIRRLFCNHNFR